MRRWLGRLIRIVVLLSGASTLGFVGYAVWHFQSGGTAEELADEASDLRAWMLEEDGGITRFVRRALFPVAQPSRAFEHAKSAASFVGDGSVGWLKDGQRWLTDGSARVQGIAERDARRSIDYKEMLEIGGAMLDTGTGGRSGIDGVRLYFGPDEPNRRGGLSEALLGFVNDAQVSIACACDTLEWEPLAAALAAARKRGLETSVVTQAAARDLPALRLLQDSGVGVSLDDRDGRMRHRFCVADGRDVWIGSTVFDQPGLFQDFSNALIIRSPELAANYAAEFEEMFDGHSFGRRSPAETPYPRLMLGEVPVENYFAPEERVENQIIAELAETEERMDFMTHEFVSRPLFDAILSRMVYGVDVRGIVDRQDEPEERGYTETLAERGVEMYAEESAALLNHGVVILDYQTVVLGSFSFGEETSKKNDSSILIIESAPLAVRYLKVMDGMISP